MMREEKRVVVWSLVLLGAGLGGFIDGIVFHQLLQWHNMGSAVVPPVTMEAMSLNMAWDGWFHLATWLVTVIGITWLWSDAKAAVRMPETPSFAGHLLFGWGAFNLVEGAVNHLILEIHHVRDLPVHEPTYDWTFLVAGGCGLLALGGWLVFGARSAPLRRVPDVGR